MSGQKEILKNKYIGKVFNTSDGVATITDYHDKNNIEITFDEGSKRTVRLGSLKTGSVKNFNKPSVYGIGYLGGKVVNQKARILWASIIRRCYSEEDKYFRYKNVTVCEEWHNFQNFAKWYEENYKPEYMEGWHLDKDIIYPDSKQYSPKTCSFVPNTINSLLSNRKAGRGSEPIGVSKKKSGKFLASFTKNGEYVRIALCDTVEEAFLAYKKEKECYIKEVAEKWKGLISEDVYNALINYEVKITD